MANKFDLIWFDISPNFIYNYSRFGPSLTAVQYVIDTSWPVRPARWPRVRSAYVDRGQSPLTHLSVLFSFLYSALD